MAQSRKQAQPKSGKKTTAPVPIKKPNTRAQSKEQSPVSMADGAISDCSEEHPDIEQILEDQILSPKIALADFQQQTAVRTMFNAWINGLISGKDARSHFQSNFGEKGVGLDLNDHDEHLIPNPHSNANVVPIAVPLNVPPLIWSKLILRTLKRRFPSGNPLLFAMF